MRALRRVGKPHPLWILQVRTRCVTTSRERRGSVAWRGKIRVKHTFTSWGAWPTGCSRCVLTGSSVQDEVVCLFSCVVRAVAVARHNRDTQTRHTCLYPGKSRRDHTTPSNHPLCAVFAAADFSWIFPVPFSFAAGPDAFRDDVLKRLGGPESADQFDKLLAECQPLMEAAGALPSLSLRSDKWAAVILLRCN